MSTSTVLFPANTANSYGFSDLSKIGNLKQTLLEGFNHQSEEVKSAASYALGNVSLGNLSDYLPFVLKEIETQPKRQYLLLHSLKEVTIEEQIYLCMTSVYGCSCFRSFPHNPSLAIASACSALMFPGSGPSSSGTANALRKVPETLWQSVWANSAS